MPQQAPERQPVQAQASKQSTTLAEARQWWEQEEQRLAATGGGAGQTAGPRYDQQGEQHQPAASFDDDFPRIVRSRLRG